MPKSSESDAIRNEIEKIDLSNKSEAIARLKEIHESDRSRFEGLVYDCPTKGIPTVPDEWSRILNSAYCRYQNFIGIAEGVFDETEIENDRRQYSHLLLPLTEEGMIQFGQDECIEYMHICSGAPKHFCAAHLYDEEVVVIASSNTGEEAEIIQEFYESILAYIDSLPLNEKRPLEEK